MNKNLSALLLFLVGTLLFISCQKELNFSTSSILTPGTGGGSAKYKFVGGTSSCAGALIAGTYNAGTALTNQNTITLKVTVDSIGSYALATANINGVIFSGAGNFTSTGPQSIILQGSGTPVTAGSFNFIPGAAGCSFSISFTAKSTGVAQFTLNGAPDSCIAPVVSGTYRVGTVINATNTVVIKVSVTTPGTYTVSSNAVNGILFSGSGTFIANGQQSITLTGSGLPLKSGTFTFTPGTYGCKFTVYFTE
jgi:hypothetical protein